MILAAEVGCGSEDSLTPVTDASAGPVTVSFLRHDNPNYVKADKEFFAATGREFEAEADEDDEDREVFA